MTSNGRVARLTALALATGTLVAASSVAASAATTTSTTDRIQGLGSGKVVHIHIALPVALPVVGQIIDQYISSTDGTVTTVNNLGATSVGQIGKGQVPVLSDILKGTAASALDGKQSDNVSLIDQDVAAIGLSVKALAANSMVAKPNLDGVLSHANSTVASVKLNMLGVPALNAAVKPLTDVLTSTLGTVNNTQSTTTATVVNALTPVTQQLDAVTNSSTASATVKTAAAQTSTALTSLLNAIQTKVAGLDANTKLIDLGVMTSDQKITRVGHQVTSDVSNELAGVSLLGGLITVDALKSEAMATAGGAPGTAHVIHTPGVLTVHIADLLTLKIGDTIELGGTIGDALPADLKSTVNGALAQVLDLLRTQLGLDFHPSAFSENISADGSSASTAVSAAQLVLNPPVLAGLLPAGEKLLTVNFVEANAAVGAQVVTLHKTSSPSVSPVTRQALPHTGANLPLTGGAAAAMIGLAMVARRRRLAQIAE